MPLKSIFLTLGAVALSEAITCQNLKTMYSDLTCCKNSQTDTCMREIPLCSDGVADGDICIRSDGNATMKPRVDGSTIYVDPLTEELSVRTASTSNLGVLKVDGTTVTMSEGVLSGFSGDYNDLTNLPTEASLPAELTNLMTPLEVDQSKVGFGIQPETALHVGGSEEIGVTASRYECSGYYALQTTGTVATPLTVEECTAYNGTTVSTVEGGGAVLHTSDTACTGGTVTGGSLVATDNKTPVAGEFEIVPYANEIISKTDCETIGNSMSQMYDRTDGTPTEGLCINYGSRADFYAADYADRYKFSNDYPNTGPMAPKSTYVDTTRSYINSDGTTNTNRAVQRTGYQLKSTGSPSYSLSLKECEAYAASIGTDFEILISRFWNLKFPGGCSFGNHHNAGGGVVATRVVYNGFFLVDYAVGECGVANNLYLANEPFSCVEAVLPESTIAGFCGEECSGSASFSVDTATGQCTCGTESAETCTKEASPLVDLYSPYNPPQGCFIEDGVIYHNPDAGGDCSQNSACIRKAECFAESIESTTVAVGMISEDKAWFKNGIIVSSDVRIKKNIVEVPDNQALDQLRQIPIKFYEYVDSSRGDKTIGFIAQEVKEVFPLAVSVGKGFVPNMMKRLSCHYWREVGDVDLRMNCDGLVSGKTYRLFVSKQAEPEKIVDVTVDAEGITRMRDIYSSVFAYGEEVEDFHKLDKQKLFALAFSATQELDKEVVELQQQVAELVDRVKALEAGR